MAVVYNVAVNVCDQCGHRSIAEGVRARCPQCGSTHWNDSGGYFMPEEIGDLICGPDDAEEPVEAKVHDLNVLEAYRRGQRSAISGGDNDRWSIFKPFDISRFTVSVTNR